jgi:uncharacterized protein involved in exopolysaccharide biosynthesis
MSAVATYLSAAKGQWPILALSSLLVGIGLGGLPFLERPNYRAETVLLVSFVTPSQDSVVEPSGGAGTGTTSASPDSGPTLPPEVSDRVTARRVTTFTQVANTRAVTQPAISALGLPYTPEQLGQEISASTPFNTKVIDIGVTDPDPQRAADIANAIAAELKKFAAGSAVLAGEQQPVLSVTRAASKPSTSVPVAWKIPLVTGLLAGLALGLAIAVLRRGATPSVTGRT